MLIPRHVGHERPSAEAFRSIYVSERRSHTQVKLHAALFVLRVIQVKRTDFDNALDVPDKKAPVDAGA